MTENTAAKSDTAKQSKTFPVTLLRNYVPAGEFTVLGHHKEAVRVRNTAGLLVELEPACFVKGEAMPAEYAGAGYEGKIWAGTQIELPVAEAASIIKAGIAERADELPA